jgi:glutamate racemase
MEPAVKPAARISHSGVIGVFATPATLQGQLFSNTVYRFAPGARIVRQVCPGLVERIEAGDLHAESLDDMLRTFLQPSRDAGADTLVLACTHYAFVRARIERLAGPEVQVIDPAVAIARQAGRLASGPQATDARSGSNHLFVTTGDVGEFEHVAHLLLGKRLQATAAVWRCGQLHAHSETGNNKGGCDLQPPLAGPS